MPATKISELTETIPQNPDQIPIGRGFGGTGLTLKITVQKLLEPVNNLINNLITNFNNLSGAQGIHEGDITNLMLAKRPGLSVIGRDVPSFGSVVDIDGTANQVLRVSNSGTVLDFGSINLASSQAVTNVLPISSGGSGYMDGRTLVPAGAVMPIAVNTAPVGWLICNGETIGTSGTVQGVNADQLQTLRNLLGITYGSYGQLPDLRGYFVRGFGTNTNSVSSGDFGKQQTDTFQGHKHGIYDPGHTHNINNQVLEGPEWIAFSRSTGRPTNPPPGPDPELSNGYETNNTNANDRIFYIVDNATNALVQNPTADSANVGSPVGNSGGTAPRTADETRPRNIAMLYCIKY